MKKWNPPEGCFQFDRKQPEGDKRVFLLTFCFYFRVAHFTYFSLLLEVDKSFYLHAPCLKPIYGFKASDSDSSTDDLTCEVSQAEMPLFHHANYLKDTFV